MTMKTTNKILALALVAVAMIFASCSKDDDSAQKDADNFSRDIIGMWEGVEVTGEETNSNAEARVAYFDDGTFIYYFKVADLWFPRRDEASKYSIEGNKLTSRWKPEMAENYSSEWWNIDAIKGGVMKWSARRERKDGSQYTATFTWKKVDDTLASEQIMAKLTGTWEDVDSKNFSLLKGEIIDTTLNLVPPQLASTLTFNNDGKCWFSLPDVTESTKKFTAEYTYSVKGNVLTLITEKYLVDGVETEEHVVNDIRVVNAISDDELILVLYEEFEEDFIELLGHDAALSYIRMKKVE